MRNIIKGIWQLTLLFERTFKVIYEDHLQLFRTLLGFRNILTQNSAQSAILVL